jgi:hypothetical protein
VADQSVRGHRVILDAYLAALYDVSTGALNHRPCGETWDGFPRTSCFGSPQQRVKT